jgi:hypothetical protein
VKRRRPDNKYGVDILPAHKVIRCRDNFFCPELAGSLLGPSPIQVAYRDQFNRREPEAGQDVQARVISASDKSDTNKGL